MSLFGDNVENPPVPTGFAALGDQIDLAAPVSRRLRLAHVNLREMPLQRAPQRNEAFTLKRLDHEIAAWLQPSYGKFERQLTKMD